MPDARFTFSPLTRSNVAPEGADPVPPSSAESEPSRQSNLAKPPVDTLTAGSSPVQGRGSELVNRLAKQRSAATKWIDARYNQQPPGMTGPIRLGGALFLHGTEAKALLDAGAVTVPGYDPKTDALVFALDNAHEEMFVARVDGTDKIGWTDAVVPVDEQTYPFLERELAYLPMQTAYSNGGPGGGFKAGDRAAKELHDAQRASGAYSEGLEAAYQVLGDRAEAFLKAVAPSLGAFNFDRQSQELLVLEAASYSEMPLDFAVVDHSTGTASLVERAGFNLVDLSESEARALNKLIGVPSEEWVEKDDLKSWLRKASVWSREHYIDL